MRGTIEGRWELKKTHPIVFHVGWLGIPLLRSVSESHPFHHFDFGAQRLYAAHFFDGEYRKDGDDDAGENDESRFHGYLRKRRLLEEL